MGFVLFADDVHAQFNAFITDEHGGPGYQFPDFVLTFSTERTVKNVFVISCHKIFFNESMRILYYRRVIVIKSGLWKEQDLVY
jgi:hypothetical protein